MSTIIDIMKVATLTSVADRDGIGAWIDVGIGIFGHESVELALVDSAEGVVAVEPDTGGFSGGSKEGGEGKESG